MGSDNLREALRDTADDWRSQSIPDSIAPSFARVLVRLMADEVDALLDEHPEPAPSLAGQREQIAKVLAQHFRSAGCDPQGRMWTSCACGWEDEDRNIDPFKWADHRLEAVLATLVDLGSEETRATIARAIGDPGSVLPRELDARGFPGESITRWSTRAVLAALSSPSASVGIEVPADGVEREVYLGGEQS